MSLDWNAVGALGGWVAASVAFSAFLLQRRQISFSANLDSLWRLQDEFNSEDMCDKRSRVAKRLIAGNTAHDRDTEDILDFFDLIGYLVEQKALDKVTSWMLFSDAGLSYWFGATTYLKANNAKSLYWGHLSSLVRGVFIPLEMQKEKMSKDAAESAGRKRSAVFLTNEITGKAAALTRRSVTSAPAGRASTVPASEEERPQPAESVPGMIAGKETTV